MAASVSVKTRAVTGSKRRIVAEVTGDTSYPTGGYEVAPKQLGLRVIDDAQVSLKIGSGAEATPIGGGYYTPSSKKLVIQNYKTQAELANATNISSVVLIMEAWGR